MAVKYSKTRDFGAKGRKTRKLGNKMFTLRKVFTRKGDAKVQANAWKYGTGGKKMNVRVVKITRYGKVRYGVYTHGKR
tara:strand:+ start:40 stop:273 length:234 start_codon:yes stop_codon:yes gene_type:complete